ncbi:hypothetical protein KDA_01600 [Dictyobacter alpinus]|uniref:Uncharacterized protein n=1 Tax=Dictyobacter alpinus TaxID=2014873 RepID=A0A402AZZ3_9CHLR|nr:hypothetical protein KDA_01600 [Dictyobacter alpinus]
MREQKRITSINFAQEMEELERDENVVEGLYSGQKWGFVLLLRAGQFIGNTRPHRS